MVFMISEMLAPPFRWSISITWAVLLPPRMPAGFGAGAAFLPWGAFLAAALTSFGLEGFDGEAGLFHRAGHEPADGVTLPAHGFHDLGDAGPALPLEHLDNLGRLAAPTHACGFRRGRGLFALGRFLGGGRLLGRLALHRR